MTEPRWIVAVTGASGAPYAVRLLRALVDLAVPADVIISSHGWRLLTHEVGISSETIKNLTISAMLSQLIQSTENPELLDKINNLKEIVEQYGLGDLVFSQQHQEA